MDEKESCQVIIHGFLKTKPVEINSGENRPWWLSGLRRVSNSSRHSLAAVRIPLGAILRINMLNKKALLMLREVP